MQQISFLLLAGIVFFSSCNSGGKSSTDASSESENSWISLFDGETLSGWRSFNSNTITGWTVEDGNLTALGEGGDLGGDIITEDKYESFELYLEWKIAPGGNSGVLFHVVEEGHKTTYETGPEYQLLDDVGFPVKVADWQLTGANYAMHTASEKTLKPVGEWNTTRIIVDGSHVEHWLNGEKVVEYELWSEEWNKLKDSGKWKDYPDYGMAKKGHIALQDHGSKVWFRNIKIRPID